MSRRPVLGLDVDEVVADLHTPWLKWIEDTLGFEDPVFDRWDIDEVYGKEVMDFLCADIYDEDIVQPYPGSLVAVQALTLQGWPIVWVTSCAKGTEGAKLEWLARHGLLMDGHQFLPTHRKGDAPVDYLVDDAPHNVRHYPHTGILVRRSHNAAVSWPRVIPSLGYVWRYLP